MSRSLKYEIPGEDPRVSIDEVAAKGWAALFDRHIATQSASRPVPRVLEIGFGRGEFLLELATLEADTQFIGVEVSFKRTLKMARKVARAKLGNVRLIEARAEVAVQNLFEPESLDAIWINFSDPWPKFRHAHRRVIQAGFVGDAAVCLKPSGTLYVATDDVPYAHQMDEVLSNESRLKNAYAPWPFLAEVSGRPQTGYEVQWREVGRPMHFFCYRPAKALTEASATTALIGAQS